MTSTARGRDIELAEKVSTFIREEVIPYEKDLRNHGHGPAEDLVRELRDKARQAGLLAPHLASEWGGHGLTHRETATVFRAAGYSPLGPVALNIMAPDEGNMHLLERVATQEQKERFLRPLASGTIRSAFLMTEPDGGAGSDPSMIKTVATRSGDDWLISGRKWLITGADGAGFGIIMAKTGESATMFLADMSTPGIRIERILDTIDNSMPGGHAVIVLENVRVPACQVLGEVDQGFKYAQVRLSAMLRSLCTSFCNLGKHWKLAFHIDATRATFTRKRSRHGLTLQIV